MSAYEILVRCGYSPDDASRISGMPKPSRPEMAAAMEARYDSVPTSAYDRICDKYDLRHSKTYYDIENMAGNNGECHTRRGTWRRMKFGKGNKGGSWWLRQGFPENVKETK